MKCYPCPRNGPALSGVPDGIRTRVLALKGPRPGPLDDGDCWCDRSAGAEPIDCSGAGPRRPEGLRGEQLDRCDAIVQPLVTARPGHELQVGHVRSYFESLPAEVVVSKHDRAPARRDSNGRHTIIPVVDRRRAHGPVAVRARALVLARPVEVLEILDIRSDQRRCAQIVGVLRALLRDVRRPPLMETLRSRRRIRRRTASRESMPGRIYSGIGGAVASSSRLRANPQPASAPMPAPTPPNTNAGPPGPTGWMNESGSLLPAIA
jgi:hypothetical protein